jgi:hypothetical protein
MIHFNLTTQVPRITIIYLNFGGNEDNDDDVACQLPCSLKDATLPIPSNTIFCKFYRHSMPAPGCHLRPDCQA